MTQTDTTDLKEALLNLATRISNSATEPAHASIAIKAADALDAKDRTIERLEAALKECASIFWRSPAQDDRRSRFYPAWKNALAALKGQTP